MNLTLMMTVICLQFTATMACGQDKPESEVSKMNEEYQQMLTNILSFMTSQNLDQLKQSVTAIETLANRAESPQSNVALVLERKVELCLAALQVITASKDVNFAVDDVPERNIAPPEGGYSAGVAPESIKDEKVRKEYEMAIAKNMAKIANYNFQYRLRRIENAVLTKTEKYVSEALSNEPESSARLIELFKKYGTEKETRTRILNHLKSPASNTP